MSLNPTWNNPNLTTDEEWLVNLIHDKIVEHQYHTGEMCGLGAGIVVAILGPGYRILDGHGHWWAENVMTGARLDPTADQFETDVCSGEEWANKRYYKHRYLTYTTFRYVKKAYRIEWHDWAMKFVKDQRAMHAQRRMAA